jgi:hypothetical protein
MLTQTALQPLYGKLSDIVGRKVSDLGRCPFSSSYSHKGCSLFEYFSFCSRLVIVWRSTGEFSCPVLSSNSLAYVIGLRRVLG